MLALSLAKSASMMRPLAMSVLSFMLARLFAVWFRRLMLAPKAARRAATASRAVFTTVMLALAPPVISTPAVPGVV
ncbi:hypothetical protein D9M69_552270 [compost metagenome]